MNRKTKSFFSLLASLILLFTVSFSVLSIIEFSQVKKEYSSLDFIPADAEFVMRIDAKQMGKDFFKRIIESGNTDFLSQEKQKNNEQSSFNIATVDWTYPVYLFLLKTNNQWATVSVFSLRSNGGFADGKKKVPYQYAYEFQQKGFLVSGCSEQSFQLVKKQIEDQNSSGWNKLKSKKESIAFQTKMFQLSGAVQLLGNDLIIESDMDYLQSTTKNRTFLKPEGFHISTIIPTKGMDLLVKQAKKYLDFNWGDVPEIESASINYLGLKPPYFPQFQLLLNTSEPFAINEFIEGNDLAIVRGDKSEIKLGELSLNGREIDDYSYLLTTVPTRKINYYSTQNLGDIEGDLNKLIEFDKVPMLKMVLLLNSKIAAASQFIEKTKRVSLTATSNKSTKKQHLILKIEMKPNKNFLDEVIQLLKALDS
jgi:hypothetical protein